MPDPTLSEDSENHSGLSRAPLLGPALVFAAGCSWGAGRIAFFWPSLATVLLLGALWLRCRTAPQSLLPFLGAIFFLGAGAASFYKGWRPADDLHYLPQAKFDADCWWAGTICTVPMEKEREGDRDAMAILAIRRAWVSGIWRSASGRVLLEVRSAPPGGLRLSQGLWVRGALRSPGKPRNPGDPDWQEILAGRRIAYRLKASWNDIRALDPGSWVGRQVAAARAWASHLLQKGIESDRETVALLTGMIYGQTGGLPAKTEEEFRLAGAYHVFAVSGQNVGAFLAVGLALFEAGRVSRWRWGWLLLPAVAFYALLSGASASVGRAALLAGLVMAAWLLRRPVSLLNLWAASLLFFLSLEPLSVTDVGLQLSFGVVLALLLLSGPLARWIAAPFSPDPFIPRSLLPCTGRIFERLGKGFGLLLGSSLAASLGALPFEIVHFHFVSFVGPFANLLVVPLAELVVTVGTLSLCFGTLWSLLGTLLNNANWLFARTLLATVTVAAHLPAAGIAVGDPRSLLCGSPGLRLLFPAIPVGSCCLVRWHGKVLLVEGGERGTLFQRIEPIRRFYGWNWLDAAIRRERRTWQLARGAPWGASGAFAPFEQFSPANGIRLRQVPLPSRKGEGGDGGSALLFQAEGIPLLALCLEASLGTPSRQQQGSMDLFFERRGPASGQPAAPPVRSESLWLSLTPAGASLAELDPQGKADRGQSLGKSAIEVVLVPGRAEFRPYRRRPLSYPIGLAQEEGATSQTPSSPEACIQEERGSNPPAWSSREKPFGEKR